jgi:hypothetical protein
VAPRAHRPGPARSQARTAAADRPEVAREPVIAGDGHHGPPRARGRHPERVALALDDEHRAPPDGVELGQRLWRAGGPAPSSGCRARRAEREGEAQDARRARGARGPAGHARARTSARR